MTREEAIEDFMAQNAFIRDANTLGSKETLERNLLAIKALQQEPCEDAISRAEVLKKAFYTETEEGWSGYTVDVKDIKDLPSVQPKHKTGTWRKDIDNSRRWDRVRFYCSECGSWQTYGETDYCPSCGARMIKPQEE